MLLSFRTSRCRHLGSRLKRLGILNEPKTHQKYFLLVCQSCGSTISTRTLRAQKELHEAHRLNLALC